MVVLWHNTVRNWAFILKSASFFGGYKNRFLCWISSHKSIVWPSYREKAQMTLGDPLSCLNLLHAPHTPAFVILPPFLFFPLSHHRLPPPLLPPHTYIEFYHLLSCSSPIWVTGAAFYWPAAELYEGSEVRSLIWDRMLLWLYRQVSDSMRKEEGSYIHTHKFSASTERLYTFSVYTLTEYTQTSLDISKNMYK